MNFKFCQTYDEEADAMLGGMTICEFLFYILTCGKSNQVKPFIADDYIIKKAHTDDAKMMKAGVKVIKLTGKVRDAYIRTIYEAKWAENDSKKYNVDYKKLKAALYDPNR